MDTSETYIKMVCLLPDEFWNAFKDDLLTPQVCSHCNRFILDRRIACCNRMNRLPAPRQDQLQEMMEYNNQAFLLDCFNNFVDLLWPSCHPLAKPETSLEQLWLAFVMKEKYGKVWNGENWVKSD